MSVVEIDDVPNKTRETREAVHFNWGTYHTAEAHLLLTHVFRTYVKSVRRCYFLLPKLRERRIKILNFSLLKCDWDFIFKLLLVMDKF
jgi:hypothetical protein